MTKDEALDLALEALEWDADYDTSVTLQKAAITAIKQARSAPVQEPVAVYGYCPICGAEGVMRERRLNGYDKCAKGHTYPSSKATPPAQPAPVQEPVAWQVMVEDEAMEEFSVKDAAHDWCVQQKLAGSPYSYWIRPLYTTPTVQEFVCSTGLCHYKATSEKRECMNCAAFGECNPNNDAGRCGYEPPAAQRKWVGLQPEALKKAMDQERHNETAYWIGGFQAGALWAEKELRKENGGDK